MIGRRFFPLDPGIFSGVNSLLVSGRVGLPKTKVVFQPSIFRGCVSFRESTPPKMNMVHLKSWLYGGPAFFRWSMVNFGRYICIYYMCWGLNSHWLPVVGMVINPMYIHYKDSLSKVGMTIPNISSLDPYCFFLFFLCLKKKLVSQFLMFIEDFPWISCSNSPINLCLGMDHPTCPIRGLLRG